MEHTASLVKPKKDLITSLLKVFAMFGFRFIDDRDEVEAVDIRCINCKKDPVLYLNSALLKEMITKFLLNAILHHVGIS